MRLQQRMAIALMMLAAVGASAQTKPDFSGRWILETASESSPDVPPALSVSLTLIRTTVHGEPMTPFFKDITIERQFERGPRSETHTIGVLGGSVSGGSVAAGGSGLTARFSVKWDGDALVFESGSHTSQRPDATPETERREVWTLDPSGRLRIVIATRSADRSEKVTLVYRRVTPPGDV